MNPHAPAPNSPPPSGAPEGIAPISRLLPIRNPQSAIRNSSPPAFTLIEVVVALTILSMMTGTLFAIIQGSVRAASQIEQLQRETDSINRLLDGLRKTFSSLPSTATLTLTLPDANATDQQELLITGAPNTFGFGIKPISYSPTTIALRPDAAARVDEAGAPLHSLSISREDLIPPTDESSGVTQNQELDGVLAQDDQGRTWMPLLPEVSTLKWRFYQLKDETWLEEWSRSTWPDLIEIQLLMRDRVNPIRMVFSVPVIAITKGTGTAPTTSSTPAAPAPQGGARSPGGNTGSTPPPQGGSR
ncbi:MAG: prepilin-type N-terminal cleavage/methylation domain-containing protein [Verrucomicrobiaceae bacterium]|nr:prepilin-type N-terminal cleavage/methylation domain-containing protein [Verrucomicrobiaceae bacterium]